MDNPELCPDVASIGFSQEFGTGTLIGTQPQNTLDITNGGSANLVVQSATLTGDPAFTLATSYLQSDGTYGSSYPATIAGGKHLLLAVTFAPLQARGYAGVITVVSNADNVDGGVSKFPVSGCGIPADGGRSPCYYDGGTPP
jgi:hypothetical protein